MNTTTPLRPGQRVTFNIGPVAHTGTITSVNENFGTAIIDYGADAPSVEALEDLIPAAPLTHGIPTSDRLHIAALAMQGLLAGGMLDCSPRYIASRAAEYAHALINTINNQPQ